jgi:CRP-like cAMP-binding protein
LLAFFRLRWRKAGVLEQSVVGKSKTGVSGGAPTASSLTSRTGEILASEADLDAAMAWQDEPQGVTGPPHVVRAILAGLAKAAGKIGKAATWLTMDGHAVVRWFMRHVEKWFGPPDRSLDELASKAHYSILANRFGSAAKFAIHERAMIEATDLAKRTIHQAGSELCVEGEASPGPMYIMSGWAVRIRVLAHGRQHVVGLLLPGDGICLHGDIEPRALSTVMAVTMVETVDATRLLNMAHAPQKHPGLARAVERAAALQETFSDNHILRLGALSDVERAGHLMFELRWRLAEAGLADQRQFPLPLTHETLAELLGMTVKRARKAMRRLRAFQILAVRYGRARLLEQGQRGWFGGFTPPGPSIVRRSQSRILASV